ncbi:MAG: SAM-dependent chlorinase/fluorinase [Schleiferiaceae bacterium]|nr:SAM-dependent chlorinase/fluorinase [Schleiferiaceae bacterium]
MKYKALDSWKQGALYSENLANPLRTPHMLTLTSDYGVKDFFVGAFKGSLYAANPDVTIVDLSHHVKPYGIAEAAFILQQAYPFFPKKTVHIVLVNVEQCYPDRLVAMEMDGHFFLGGDNGLLPMIRPDFKPDRVVQLAIGNHQDLTSAWAVLAKAAIYLESGGALHVLGSDYSCVNQSRAIKPSVFEEGTGILGNVIYIDNFGNLITNINKQLFDEVFGKQQPTIYLPRNRKVKKLHENYHSEGLTPGDIAAIFNYGGLLEIGIVNAGVQINGANKLLHVKENDTIRLILE